MKKILKNTFVLVLILALFFSCSRYEDGPLISFSSVQSRIKGLWYVEEFSRNEEDLTGEWENGYNWTFYFDNVNGGLSNGVSYNWYINMNRIPDGIIPDSAISYNYYGIFRF